MSNRLRTVAFAVAAAIPLSLLAPSVANATGGGYNPPPPRGDEGCTPGFWKNHTNAWDAYSPNQTVGSVFSGASASLADDTLLQALSYQGGTGLLGAERILLRAAVAALLNSTDNVVDYPLYTSEVRNRVSAALGSDDRQRILNLANNLDQKNNLGCPL
jgi:hypothetical protein